MNHRLLAVYLLSACLLPGQDKSSAAADAKTQDQARFLTNSISSGVPLPVTINVSDNVNVEAVMLPRAVSRHVFGKEIADNYAVIEVNVSNRSNTAALVLQSLFIDVSEWKLAGDGLKRKSGSKHCGKTYQSCGSADEIASVEYRIVRGQMLDQQPFTLRNLTVRAFQVLGSIGTAYAFPFSTPVVKGIGAWNGAVVPGADVFWPDGMVGQLNRISDYGFRNNKIIPQQSADIVVAFFPIDRFLTPSLRTLFLNSPALFFNPFLMSIDPKTRRLLNPVLRNVFGDEKTVKDSFTKLLKLTASQDDEKIDSLSSELEELQGRVQAEQAAVAGSTLDKERAESALESDSQNNRRGQAASQDREALDKARQEFQTHFRALEDLTHKRDEAKKELDGLLLPMRQDSLYRFFNAISLNNVHITVSGVMSVDEMTVPASIESSCFDKAGPEMWGIAGDKTCSLTGKFLQDGVPKIADADKLGISGLTVDKDASTSEMLKFTFKLAKALDSPVSFTIVVEKAGTTGKPVDSMKYAVNSNFTLTDPSISSLKPAKSSGSITVSGSGFFSGPTASLKFLVRPASAADKTKDVSVTPDAGSTGTSFTLNTAKFGDAVQPGCYKVVVEVGDKLNAAVSSDVLRVDANPKIRSAKKSGDGKTLTITGEQLIGAADCGGSNPEFEFLGADGKVIGNSVPLPPAATDTSATLTLPAKATQVRIKGSTAAVQIQ